MESRMSVLDLWALGTKPPNTNPLVALRKELDELASRVQWCLDNAAREGVAPQRAPEDGARLVAIANDLFRRVEALEQQSPPVEH
jgi:hypothetical protein